MTEQLPFVDLQAQRRRLGTVIDDAIAWVLAHGSYILGPEVAALEDRLAAFCGARHAIACSNGTDALVLALRALGAGAGDGVVVPSFTFPATAEAVALVGATPVFVDVTEDTFVLDPAALAAVIAEPPAGVERLVGVVPVDLFGHPADHRAIASLAASAGLWVLDDAAQGYGAVDDAGIVGSLGTMATTSFFPAKPLGCYGDGGAVLTGSDDLAELVRSFHNHGAGVDRYDNVRIGMNARLDTIQAAVLLEKLAIFPDEVERRGRIATRYSDLLGDVVRTPELRAGVTSTWAQYTVRLPARDAVAAKLKAEGIPTAVYYRTPVHQQPAYRDHPVGPGGLPVTERLAQDVLSLPMHPYLSEADQDRIVGSLQAALALDPVA